MFFQLIIVITGQFYCFGTNVATLQPYNIVGLMMERFSICAEADVLFNSTHSFFPCQNLDPTLPRMQLKWVTSLDAICQIYFSFLTKRFTHFFSTVALGLPKTCKQTCDMCVILVKFPFNNWYSRCLRVSCLVFFIHCFLYVSGELALLFEHTVGAFISWRLTLSFLLSSDFLSFCWIWKSIISNSTLHTTWRPVRKRRGN